jgi:hypothetical protein
MNGRQSHIFSLPDVALIALAAWHHHAQEEFEAELVAAERE